jgi:hypothetical protein
MSGGSQEQKTKGFKPVMNRIKSDLLPAGDAFFNEFGAGQGLFEGSRLAPEDELVRAGQDRALGLVPGMADQFTGLQDVLGGFLAGPESAGAGQLREAARQEAQRGFNRAIGSTVQGQVGGSGQGGSRQAALALGAASSPFSTGLIGLEGQLRNAQMNNQMRALGMAPGIIGSQLLPGQIEEGVGQQRSAREQLELQDQIQEFEAPRANQLRGLLEQQGFLTPMAGLEQTTSIDSGGGGLLGALKGGLGAAAEAHGLGMSNPWTAGLGVLGALGGL